MADQSYGQSAAGALYYNGGVTGGIAPPTPYAGSTNNSGPALTYDQWKDWLNSGKLKTEAPDLYAQYGAGNMGPEQMYKSYQDWYQNTKLPADRKAFDAQPEADKLSKMTPEEKLAYQMSKYVENLTKPIDPNDPAYKQFLQGYLTQTATQDRLNGVQGGLAGQNTETAFARAANEYDMQRKGLGLQGLGMQGGYRLGLSGQEDQSSLNNYMMQQDRWMQGRSQGGGLGQAIGGVVGGIGGFLLGGPAGAAVGAGLGGGLGGNIGQGAAGGMPQYGGGMSGRNY